MYDSLIGQALVLRAGNLAAIAAVAAARSALPGVLRSRARLMQLYKNTEQLMEMKRMCLRACKE
jgi:hypothetical protein